MAKVLLNVIGAHVTHESGSFASRPVTAEAGSTYFDEDNSIPYLYGASGWVVDPKQLLKLIAGEAHLGEMGAWSDLIVVTPAIAAAAFSANDIVGGKLTIPGAVRVAAGKGKITGLKLVDKSQQNADLLVFLFKADLAGTYADNSAEAVTAADWLKWVGTIKILSTDYEEMANASLVDLGFELDIEAAAGTTLYALIVTTGTPTYGANALQLTFAVGEGS